MANTGFVNTSGSGASGPRKTKDGYIPRLTFTITSEQQSRIQKLLPWGTITKIFGVFLDELVSVIEEMGEQNKELVIAALVSRRVSIIDVLKKKEVTK